MSTPEHPDHRAGIIAGLSAYTVWGLLTIYWKQLHEFDAFELIGWRVCAASVLMRWMTMRRTYGPACLSTPRRCSSTSA